jgi:hypothetical protein
MATSARRGRQRAIAASASPDRDAALPGTILARMSGRLRSRINALLRRAGYEVRRVNHDPQSGPGLTLHRYLREDGSFDYAAYKRIQTEGNRLKLDQVWVREDNIALLAAYIRSLIPSPEFGICHGTRRGKEQEWFRHYLGCEVIGTEISGTAELFPHTIQWDFHEVKPEWIKAADFIYSNSFDHSYDPEKCLNAWMRCLKKGGLCILEHSTLHGPEGATELDPFGADITLMPFLILTWGQGRYGVRQLLRPASKADYLSHLHFIVIEKYQDPA